MEVIYIDIMEGERFVDQLPYITPPYSDWDAKAVEEYVYSKRPSLKNRSISFEFSSRKVL